MKRKLLAALTALSAATASTALAQSIAITGGKVYPVSGPPIENATVLIQDGKIIAVGTSVTIPAGATRIDATGRLVTPGLLNAASNLGLTQVGSVDATNEGSHSGDLNPSFNVAEGINPQVVNIPVARMEGVTTAITRPGGGLIPGQAVLIDLNGDRIEDMVTQSPAAMMIDLSEGSKGAGGGSRAGVMQRLRQVFQDALEYEHRKADFKKRDMQELSAPAAELEALLPVLHGTLPVFAIANRQSDIANALRLAREFHLGLVILGGTEAWKVAADLARARVPVAVYPLTNIPSFDGPGARSDNAALLAAAGVPLIVVEAETGGPRDLRFAAGFAIRYGLSWEDALKAVTLTPAAAFGVANRYGSLEAGKVADVVIWKGDPFDYSGHAEHVIIEGKDIPMNSRMTELLERYRHLPPSY
ncbi:MAG TPA: amidohydrolase family protein [Gemmatimonadales bacterium]|nr:amidohydrolase family protein [Gemmatimonadales bacterium]